MPVRLLLQQALLPEDLDRAIARPVHADLRARQQPVANSRPICAPESKPKKSLNRSPKSPLPERPREPVRDAERALAHRHPQRGRQRRQGEVGLQRIEPAVGVGGLGAAPGRRGGGWVVGSCARAGAGRPRQRQQHAGTPHGLCTDLHRTSIIARRVPALGPWKVKKSRQIALRPRETSYALRKARAALLDAVLGEVVAERALADPHQLRGVLLDAVRALERAADGLALGPIEVLPQRASTAVPRSSRTARRGAGRRRRRSSRPARAPRRARRCSRARGRCPASRRPAAPRSTPVSMPSMRFPARCACLRTK